MESSRVLGWSSLVPALVAALALGGCPPPSASCPAGFVLSSEGRCVAMGDANLPNVDANLPNVDGGVGGDAGPAMGDASRTPDACAACCTAGQMQACGMSAVGVCRMGMQTCVAGAFGTCTGNVDPTPEICNNLDDDCDGTIDETFMCRQGMATNCTTACGSMGTGMCTATCTPPAGASCSPPVETCNGLDDDCDGAADEGLEMVSAPVVGESGLVYSATQLVPTATGYMLIGLDTGSPAQFHLQALDAAGMPMGSPHAVGMSVTPPGGFPFSARAAGADFLIAYVSGSSTYVVRVNATGGPLAGPTNVGPGWVRVRIAQADAASATLYATSRTTTTPYQYSLTRYRLNVSGTTITTTSNMVVADRDVNQLVPFDAVSTTTSEYVVYLGSNGTIVFLAGASGDTATPPGRSFLRTSAQEPSIQALAIAISDANGAVSTTNPIGVAWQTSGSSPGTHIMEVTNPTPAGAGTAIALMGGTGTPITFLYVSDYLGLVPVPNRTSPFAHSGHWIVASNDAGTTNTFNNVWEVEGGTGAPSGTALTVPSNAGNNAAISLVVGSSGMRLSAIDTTGAVVTRGIGCR